MNVTFNEVVPSYAEEYFNELKKLSFEVAQDECTSESFEHLVGAHYFDDDTDLEYVKFRDYQIGRAQWVDRCLSSACAIERSDWLGGEVPDTRCRRHDNARVEYKTRKVSEHSCG